MNATKPMEINTHIMGIKDLDRVCELEERSFSMPWKREDFEDLIARDDATYVVLTVDDIVMGTAGYTYNGFEGYINNVVIDEAVRGQGLSKILLEACLNEGRKNGVHEFTLEVRVSNTPAIRLYEGFGFKSEGVRKNFYERPTEDAYVMWLRE